MPDLKSDCKDSKILFFKGNLNIKLGTTPINDTFCLMSFLKHFIYSLIQYKGYNSTFKFFDGVRFGKYFISFPAFYLIIWLMKSQQNFEKYIHFGYMTAGFLPRCQNLLR